jgi:hypothetical protein
MKRLLNPCDLATCSSSWIRPRQALVVAVIAWGRAKMRLLVRHGVE